MWSKASFIIAVQSSGSIRSASAVEPTTSANTAVTGLRSPVSLAARIFSMSGDGAAADKRAWRASSVSVGSPRASPQLAQKRASPGTGASQRGQDGCGDAIIMPDAAPVVERSHAVLAATPAAGAAAGLRLRPVVLGGDGYASDAAGTRAASTALGEAGGARLLTFRGGGT